VEVVSKPARLRAAVTELRKEGRPIALVPTMGALHHGHASLVKLARERGAAVVVSIFVNPKQFGPSEDFASYPRDLARDSDLLRQEGVDLIFAPLAEDVYPEGFSTHVEVEGLSDVLIGASRPGHMRGVATVVAKLFGLVRPDFAVFGWKDAQQLVIVTRMVRDLDLGVEIVGAPIARDPDGLAASSRNAYLDADARARALSLPRALQRARDLAAAGERSAARLRDAVRGPLSETAGLAVDHVEAVDARDLSPLDTLRGSALLLAGARIDRAGGPPVLLIDNLRLDFNADGALVAAS
jgi:pantoate--beta-alanine ligase